MMHFHFRSYIVTEDEIEGSYIGSVANQLQEKI